MKELDNKTFEAAIQSEKPVVVDFWAPWCGPCRIMGPVLEELNGEIGDKGEICKLNIDENPETATKYSVSTIPTMILFKKGEEIERMIGVRPKADVEAMIDRFQE